MQGLLVDLDGTLADSMGALKQVFFEVLLSHGIKAADEAFNRYVGSSIDEILQDLRQKHPSLPSHGQLEAQYRQQLHIAYATRIQPMPFAVETLQLARHKGFKLALVTAASEEIAALFLATNRLQGVFDELICVQKKEPGKPHPALYKRALASLQLPPEKAVAIEDSTNGVHSALAAGCEVLWLTGDKLPPFNACVHRVKSWLDIKKRVERNGLSDLCCGERFPDKN